MLIKLNRFLSFSKLVPQLNYNFSGWINPKDRKKYVQRHIFEDVIKDDLKFDHNHEFNGGIIQTLNYIKSNPDSQITFKGMAFVMYNAGVKNICDPEVFELFEKILVKTSLNGKFERRWIFGGLYGAIKTNAASSTLLDIFMKEFHACHEETTLQEIFQLFEAISYNKTINQEEKMRFIQEYLYTPILNKFNSYLGVKIGYVLRFIDDLIRMEFYDEDIWTLIVKYFSDGRHVYYRNLFKLIELYDFFLKLHESKKVGISFQPVLHTFRRILKSREDYKWRYNLEEKRLYTFSELKEKRDEIRYPDQLVTNRTKLQKLRLSFFVSDQPIGEKVQSEFELEKEKKILVKELDKLVMERFMTKKKIIEKGDKKDFRIGDEDIDEEEEIKTTQQTENIERNENVELSFGPESESESESDELGQLTEEEKKERRDRLNKKSKEEKIKKNQKLRKKKKNSEEERGYKKEFEKTEKLKEGDQD